MLQLLDLAISIVIVITIHIGFRKMVLDNIGISVKRKKKKEKSVSGITNEECTNILRALQGMFRKFSLSEGMSTVDCRLHLRSEARFPVLKICSPSWT